MPDEKKSYAYETSFAKIEKVFPTGGSLRILDLGCGDGRILQHLAKTHEVYGIDRSAEAVREAYAVGINAVKGDIELPFPFPDHHFDCILALDILEHVQDMDFVFGEITRVVKPDGYLLISLPNHFDVRTRFDILFGKGIIRWSQRRQEQTPWKYDHIRFWTLRELKHMLTQYGWHPELWQFNFMSGGTLPTRFVPAFKRRWLVRTWPGLWSGKFVVRCVRKQPDAVFTIIIDRTPKDF